MRIHRVLAWACVLSLLLGHSRGQERRRFSTTSNHKHHHNSSSSSSFHQHNFTAVYSSLFAPTEPPRNILEGTWAGLKTALAGSVMGLVSLVACPLALAKQKGLYGLAVGAVVGFLTGSLVTVVGWAVGLYQVAVGVWSTPAFCQAAWLGQHHWDREQHEWAWYSLSQEIRELLLLHEDSSNNRQVKDMTYYELLEVFPNATAKEIKRAYYQKAKFVHPDRNPDDQEAATKFLQLHNAYQTLVDDDQRAAYDEWGTTQATTTTGDMYNFRPDVFFAVLFGSQLVEAYIGQLTVSTFCGQVIHLLRSSSSSTLTAETLSLLRHESAYKHRKRQVEIASNLLDRIQPYVNGTVSKVQFRAICREEAERISETGFFGVKFLTLIGSNLKLQADMFLGFRRSVWRWPSGLFYLTSKKMREIVHTMQSTSKTLQVVYNILQGAAAASNETAADKKKRLSAERIEKMLPQILEMAWAHNERDIAATLDGACRKLFGDADESLENRIRRAQAVRILAEEFLFWSSDVNGDRGSTCDEEMNASNVKARLEVAFKLAQMQVSAFALLVACMLTAWSHY